MSERKPALPAETVGTEVTRFNALRHGVLSRYTVLPWEDADEYRALVAALVEEHAPQGPTKEHLVEELAGLLVCFYLEARSGFTAHGPLDRGELPLAFFLFLR